MTDRGGADDRGAADGRGAADDRGGNGGGTERRVERGPADSLPLEEALSIVGQETRAGIVVELGEAREVGRVAPASLGFSELMERVGVEDSGRFNYHLDRLVGTFVERGEDGYRLRLPGQLVYRAIVAGTLTDRPAVEPFPVGDCPDCDGRLSAAYHPDHLLTVECGDCETLFDAAHFPARGVENRSEAELLDAVYRRRHHEVGTMRHGVCHGCGAVVERALRSGASFADGSDHGTGLTCLETYAVLACTGCGTSLVGHPANVALTAPAVVGFLADHDRDAACARWWDDPVVDARRHTEVVGEEPLSVAMPFEIDGDRLRVVLDDDLQVVESERSAG